MAAKAVAVCCLIIVITALALAAAADGGSGAHTPLPGSGERKGICDALRRRAGDNPGIELVFVIRHLKVHAGYAWVCALPESRDGKQHFEDLCALLRKRNHRWEVAEMPCSEEDNPACIGAAGYFDGLRRRFPGMPVDILPAH